MGRTRSNEKAYRACTPIDARIEKSHDPNHREVQKNASTAFATRFFSSFEAEIRDHLKNRASGGSRADGACLCVASLRINRDPKPTPWKWRAEESLENSNPEFSTLPSALGNPAKS